MDQVLRCIRENGRHDRHLPLMAVDGPSADKCQAHGHGRYRSDQPAGAPAQILDGHPACGQAFESQGRLESLTVAGGWFERVARVAANAIPQASQLSS
jgi:hypothetical protein